MSEDSSQSQKSTGSPISLPPQLGSKFTSNKAHIQFADQVFKKDLDVLFSSKLLGTWKTSQYEVCRKYVPTSTAGVNLYVTVFRPPNPTAAVLFLHGFGEHQGRYVSLADMFTRNGYQVVLYDQRGNGRSGGTRGDTTVELMHRDLDIALQYVDRTLPTFVYGHALGAAIAVSFCAMNPHVNFQGVITTNAYFTLPAKYTCVKLWLVRLLKKALPNLMVNLYPSYTLASKNNYHIKKLAEDPLLQPFMTIRTAFEVMKLTDFILPNAGKFNSPILLIHGKLDRIVSHMGSVEFYGKCGSTERTLKIFEYGYHELHSDTEKDRLQQLVLTWCNKAMGTKHKQTDYQALNHGLNKQSSRLNTKFFLLACLFMLLYLRYNTSFQTIRKPQGAEYIGQCLSSRLAKLMISR